MSEEMSLFGFNCEECGEDNNPKYMQDSYACENCGQEHEAEKEIKSEGEQE